MHHRIGITADGRREMRIVFEGQAIVSDVMRRILRFHHRTQGNGLDEFLFLLALTTVHQGIQTLRDSPLRTAGLHLVAKLHHKLT